jgi:two-component system nitrogen regulation sensor histidine kinase NtrY
MLITTPLRTAVRVGMVDDIFVPFCTTKHSGSGIGLSLAQQIALMHGGKIEVATNSPNGSVFRILVPVAT